VDPGVEVGVGVGGAGLMVARGDAVQPATKKNNENNENRRMPQGFFISIRVPAPLPPFALKNMF